MKKQKLQTCKTEGKKVKLGTSNNILKLQEDRNLFARMMVVCKSRPEIDIKEAVGTYEFLLCQGQCLQLMERCSVAHVRVP